MKTEETISWVEKVYNRFTSPKFIKILGYLATILFFGLMGSAILVATSVGPYNIIDNWISDMGSFSHTPAPWLLDSALIITGILLIPFHFYTEKYLAPIPRTPEELPAPHRWSYRLTGMGFFFNMIGSISMVLVGIFSEDRDYGLHLPFSIALFGSFAFGAIFLGLALTISDRKLVPSPWNYLLGAYGIHGLLIVGVFAGYNLFLNTGWAKLWEWITLFALIAWILPLFFFCLRHTETKSITKDKNR
ncbi:MAG: DUF998 domain-containing protein [Candidatus Helarchaeota archaeon]